MNPTPDEAQAIVIAVKRLFGRESKPTGGDALRGGWIGAARREAVADGLEDVAATRQPSTAHR